MKVTITVKKEEVDALRFFGNHNDIDSRYVKQLLEKIEKEVAYNKKKEAYDKQVKYVMGDTVDKIEKRKFVVGGQDD